MELTGRAGAGTARELTILQTDSATGEVQGGATYSVQKITGRR